MKSKTIFTVGQTQRSTGKKILFLIDFALDTPESLTVSWWPERTPPTCKTCGTALT